MESSQRQIELSDLRRIHHLTVQRFPHEYLDEGLGVIGLFLHDPPKNAGYRSTPANSITFASIGVDGSHELASVSPISVRSRELGPSGVRSCAILSQVPDLPSLDF